MILELFILIEFSFTFPSFSFSFYYLYFIFFLLFLFFFLHTHINKHVYECLCVLPNFLCREFQIIFWVTIVCHTSVIIGDVVCIENWCLLEKGVRFGIQRKRSWHWSLFLMLWTAWAPFPFLLPFSFTFFACFSVNLLCRECMCTCTLHWGFAFLNLLYTVGSRSA